MNTKFDASTHTYYINDLQVPSVTSLIPNLGEFDFVNPEILEQARQEGKQNHYSIEASIRSGKPINSYAESFFQFLRDYAILKRFPEIWFSEKQFYMIEPYQVAGTPDLVLVNHEKKEFCIVDLKKTLSSFPYKYELQTSGYAILIQNEYREYKCTDRYVVAITEGKPKTIRLIDKSSQSYFMFLLKNYHSMKSLEILMRNRG